MRAPMVETGYGGGSAATIPRITLFTLFIYTLSFLGFVFVAISQATVSWTIKDYYKDFLHPDEYKGLWSTCFYNVNVECAQRPDSTWLWTCRVFLCLSFLTYAFVAGIFIARHLRPGVRISYAAGFLLISALLVLIGMVVYTAKAELPRVADMTRNRYITIEYKTYYGYSFYLGWAAMVITFMAGICSLLPVNK